MSEVQGRGAVEEKLEVDGWQRLILRDLPAGLRLFGRVMMALVVLGAILLVISKVYGQLVQTTLPLLVSIEWRQLIVLGALIVGVSVVFVGILVFLFRCFDLYYWRVTRK